MDRKSKIERGWSTPFLLLGMLLTSALTLTATEWVEQMELVPLAGIVGLIAGIALSVSAFGGLLSHLLSAIYGVAWIGFLIADVLPGELTWRERIFELTMRISNWAREVLSGGTGQDSLIFLVFLCILFWILGYNAAWYTYRRKRAWLAAVPLGIAAMVAAHFYIGDAPLIRYLVLYLLVALLYLGRTHVSAQEDVWDRERVAYNPKLGGDVLRSSFLLALLVLAVAWTLPSASSASTSVAEVWERVNTPWETVEEEWQRLFSSVHSGETEIPEPFGTSLALGGPSGLEDTLVLDIEAPPVGRYYWRATTYATYDGTQWDPPEGDLVALSPGQAVGGTSDALRQPITQTVTSYLAGRYLLVGASQPVGVAREAQAAARVEDGVPVAFHRISSILPLAAGETYTVTSRVSLADAAGLREAGTDYPAWVREQYLQLPETLPDRVSVLAERVTGMVSSPYDKARLLEQYLRNTITYDLSPPAVPPGRDYVDFLLFDSQEGYCNGYASAMVVMARSVGIPARLATGYAQGGYDEERGTFRVRENNGHAWPELYFPGYGWIEFEPTASEDPLIRPEPAPGSEPEPAPELETEEDLATDLRGDLDRQLPIPDDLSVPVTEQEPTPPQEPPWPWIVGALAALLMVGGVWWGVENLGFRDLPPAQRTYGRLLRFGKWLGRPLRTPDTPMEWGQDLAAMVPKAEQPITRIVTLYLRAAFGRGDARDLACNLSWKRVRPLLWRHLLWEQWVERLRLLAGRTGD